MGKSVFFGEVKRPELETDLLPSSEAVVEDNWRYTSNLPISIPSMDGEKCSFFLTFSTSY